MRREDLKPRIVDGDDQRHDSRAPRAQLRTELGRALVAMVTVRDQELGLRERSGVEIMQPPQPGPVDLDVRSSIRDLEVGPRIG